MKYRLTVISTFCFLAGSCLMNVDAQAQTKSGSLEAKGKADAVRDGDIAAAVRAASTKDCGCGECAAKGCKPCRGKNCFYCVAKGLTTKECGCGMCSAAGCTVCGPACDVCKFHLGPLEKSKVTGRKGSS